MSDGYSARCRFPKWRTHEVQYLREKLSYSIYRRSNEESFSSHSTLYTPDCEIHTDAEIQIYR